MNLKLTSLLQRLHPKNLFDDLVYGRSKSSRRRRKSLLLRYLPKNLWGDRVYYRYCYRRTLGRDSEFPPVKFNDHLFALKASGACYDPLINFVTDKEHVKLYIAATIGEGYIIETYRILRIKEELKEFNLDRFPCILKPTHLSGQTLVCLDSSTPLDRERLHKWFDIDYYLKTREHNYRYLVPKIIVEEFFSEDGRTIPNDYKIFCFHGFPKFIQVDSNRYSDHKRSLYSIDWNRIHMTFNNVPDREEDDPKPVLLDDMLNIAKKLSAAFRFVRVDLYATTTKIKVGELTFIPNGARAKFSPPEAEVTLGAYFGDLDGELQT